MTKASEHATNYFSYAVMKGIHDKKLLTKVYADKGYCGDPNRHFLNMNGIGDGIMRKNQINAALTEKEFQRNKVSLIFLIFEIIGNISYATVSS